MRAKYFLFCTLMLMSGRLDAQIFYVYHVSGDVKLQQGKTTRPAVKGDALDQDQRLRVGKGAKVSVLTEAGFAVVIAEEGLYNHRTISEQVDESEAVATPYFSYVWKKLREHKSADPSTMANRPRGGVSRSEWQIHTPFDSAVIIDADITFSWRGASDWTYVTIRDEAGKERFKAGLQDTLLTVYPLGCGLERGRYYTWELAGDSHTSRGAVKSLFFLGDKQFVDSFRRDEEKLLRILGELDDEAFKQEEIRKFYSARRVLRKE